MKKTIKKNTASVVPAPAPTTAKTTAPVKAATTPTAIAPPPTVAKPAVPMPAAPVTAPAPVKSAALAKMPVVSAAAPITIEAKIDVGFGNNLFVRGQGGGLSWDRGLPLENVDSKTWRLTVPAKDQVQFKLLINDTVWAKGEDLVVPPGKKVEVSPAF
jgi:hypothetical protein